MKSSIKLNLLLVTYDSDPKLFLNEIEEILGPLEVNDDPSYLNMVEFSYNNGDFIPVELGGSVLINLDRKEIICSSMTKSFIFDYSIDNIIHMYMTNEKMSRKDLKDITSALHIRYSELINTKELWKKE